jgi:hypothetical protein
MTMPLSFLASAIRKAFIRYLMAITLFPMVTDVVLIPFSGAIMSTVSPRFSAISKASSKSARARSRSDFKRCPLPRTVRAVFIQSSRPFSRAKSTIRSPMCNTLSGVIVVKIRLNALFTAFMREVSGREGSFQMAISESAFGSGG